MRRTISSVLAAALFAGGVFALWFLFNHPLGAWNGRALTGGGFLTAVGAIWLYSDLTDWA